MLVKSKGVFQPLHNGWIIFLPLQRLNDILKAQMSKHGQVNESLIHTILCQNNSILKLPYGLGLSLTYLKILSL